MFALSVNHCNAVGEWWQNTRGMVLFSFTRSFLGPVLSNVRRAYTSWWIVNFLEKMHDLEVSRPRNVKTGRQPGPWKVGRFGWFNQVYTKTGSVVDSFPLQFYPKSDASLRFICLEKRMIYRYQVPRMSKHGINQVHVKFGIQGVGLSHNYVVTLPTA